MRAPRTGSPQEIAELKQQVDRCAAATLSTYFNQLKKNANQGNRVDSGTDELGLAFLIDDDLAAILSELDPSPSARAKALPGTEYYVEHHPELLPQVKPATGLPSRIERLNETVMQLPKRLYEDFWAVLQDVAEAVSDGPDHRLDLVADGAGDALRADVALPQMGSCFRCGCCSAAFGTWRAARSITRSICNPATRCKTWPKPSTT